MAVGDYTEPTEEVGSGVLAVIESEGYLKRLDAWHLQMSVAVDGASFVLRQVDGEGLGAVADVLSRRLEDLVGSMPFP